MGEYMALVQLGHRVTSCNLKQFVPLPWVLHRERIGAVDLVESEYWSRDLRGTLADQHAKVSRKRTL